MTAPKIQLGGYELLTLEFASQGNAILGIRDSGKSYTATYLAEQLCKAGIPFIAFDPIGIWRNLKVPGAGKGYPVVVAAAENGDIDLDEENAADIVRAAMTNNVSIVIDLYSVKISKAEWRRIVQSSVEVLLYENKAHGLRHIFIEEAAEFVPQRVQREHGKVYAEIEKLARMGGNAQLGYTLINQRSEEVNKSVLELCDCLFLHRQKGRNSLTALSKWLDFGNPANTRKIVEGIAKAGPGECWLWPRAEEDPIHIKRIPQKDSFHPDRRAQHGAASTTKRAVDVADFVKTLQTALKEKHEETETRRKGDIDKDKEIEDLELSVAYWKNEAEKRAKDKEVERIPVFRNGEVAQLGMFSRELAEILTRLSATVADLNVSLTKAEQISDAAIVKPEPARPPVSRTTLPRESKSVGALGPLRGGEQYILKVLAAHHPVKVTAGQLGTLSGYTPSTMKSYMPQLRAGGFIAEDADGLSVTDKGFALFGGNKPTMPRTKQEVRELWLSRLSEGPSRILSVLINHRGRPISSEQLQRETDYTPSTLKSYLPVLRKNKLIHAAELTVSPDLL